MTKEMVLGAVAGVVLRVYVRRRRQSVQAVPPVMAGFDPSRSIRNPKGF